MKGSKNRFIDRFYVFWALLFRDLTLLKRSLREKIIDSFFILVPEIITFRYLFPLLGIPTTFIPSIFIGAGCVFIFFILGFGFVMPIAYALPHGHLFNYQLTLPLPKRWLLAEYVTYFVIETALTTTPLIIIGIILLGPLFSLTNINWLLFLITYLLSLSLLGVFFLSTCFSYPFTWFRDNLWPRRLSPLLNFSTILFTWSTVKAFSPFISQLLLLNPITYIVEGLRSSLLGNQGNLSLHFCIPALIFWLLFFCWRLKNGLYKMLDPV